MELLSIFVYDPYKVGYESPTFDFSDRSLDIIQPKMELLLIT